MTIRATVPPVNLKLVVPLEAVVPPVNLKLVVLLEAVLEDTKKQGRCHVWCQVPVTFKLITRGKGPQRNVRALTHFPENWRLAKFGGCLKQNSTSLTTKMYL